MVKMQLLSAIIQLFEEFIPQKQGEMFSYIINKKSYNTEEEEAAAVKLPDLA